MSKLVAASFLTICSAMFPPHLSAQAQIPNPCPPDSRSLEAHLASSRVTSTKPDMLGHFRFYDTRNRNVFGARPDAVVAYFGAQGSALSLEMRLPGERASAYEQPMRSAIGDRGILTCSENGCSWISRQDTWNEQAGRLTRMNLSKTIFGYIRLTCSYS